MIRVLLFAFIRAVSRVIPKDEGAWVFISDPDYADNPRALYEWIRREHAQTRISCRWLCYEATARAHKELIEAAPVKSFRGLWWLVRARVIVTSHNQAAGVICPTRQLYVALGHGIYIKAMGYLKHRRSMPQTRYRAERRALEVTRRATGFMCASSGTAKALLAACYHIADDQIEVTGIPRMDTLFARERETAKQRWFPGMGIERIFIYMPTHRIAEGRTHADAGTPIGALLDGQCEALAGMLEQENAGLLIRLHPYEQHLEWALEQALSSNRIALVREADLDAIPLYGILGACDALVTDYSSVYIEYLALDRPMIFAVPDLAAYEHARGLLLTPFSEWAPGPKVETVDQMVDELVLVCRGVDAWAEARARIRRILIDYPDANACARVWTAIQERLDGRAPARDPASETV